MVKPLSLTPHHIYDSAYVSQGILAGVAGVERGRGRGNLGAHENINSPFPFPFQRRPRRLRAYLGLPKMMGNILKMV